MAAMASYWRHPLLRNPARWLEVNKYVARENYTRLHYDTESLQHNPYAQLLAKGTAMDAPSRAILPRGSLVRLTVNHGAALTVSPAVDAPRPRGALYPRSYIINHWLYVYIASVRGSWRKCIPVKFRTKSDAATVSKVGLEPLWENAIGQAYVANACRACEPALAEAQTGLWVVLASNDEVTPPGHLVFEQGALPADIWHALERHWGARTFVPYCQQNALALKSLVQLHNYYQ